MSTGNLCLSNLFYMIMIENAMKNNFIADSFLVFGLKAVLVNRKMADVIGVAQKEAYMGREAVF